VARWTDDESGRATDVVILARGGGSLEDLWPFNDESVVRAVAAHPCPIVVGVGHETDVTLAEFAADVRAPTPSVAAELVVPSRVDELARVAQLGTRLAAALNQSLASLRQQLIGETRALEARHPRAQITADRERIGNLLDRAARVLGRRLEIERTHLVRASEELPALAGQRIGEGRAEFARATAALNALSPYATLERGYSIVRGPDGTVLTDAGGVKAGDPVSIRLQRGEIGARVESVRDSTP
jgi:exodeoxyribonuclease VII large subunit